MPPCDWISKRRQERLFGRSRDDFKSEPAAEAKRMRRVSPRSGPVLPPVRTGSATPCKSKPEAPDTASGGLKEDLSLITNGSALPLSYADTRPHGIIRPQISKKEIHPLDRGLERRCR